MARKYFFKPEKISYKNSLRQPGAIWDESSSIGLLD
jgi:hypothetical protein